MWVYSLGQDSARFLNATPIEFWALYSWKMRPPSGKMIDGDVERLEKSLERHLEAKDGKQGRAGHCSKGQ